MFDSRYDLSGSTIKNQEYYDPVIDGQTLWYANGTHKKLLDQIANSTTEENKRSRTVLPRG